MKNRSGETYLSVFSDKKYRLIILDMDGTLYYQRSMQILMCMEMLLYAFGHPFALWKLRVISIFRKTREKSSCGMNVYAYVAEKLGRNEYDIQQIIEEWMFKRPIKHMKYCCDYKLCEWIAKWKAQNKRVVIYSDYPVKDKCTALGIHLDAMYFSDEDRIGELKPSAKGIEIISEDFLIDPKEILVVGDRDSKDGKMAETAGCDYLILKKWKFFRMTKYNNFL